MSTTWTPETGTIVVPETVKEKTVTGILNRPAKNARIRATLGRSVIVGRVNGQPGYYDLPYDVLYVTVDGLPDSTYVHTLNLALWPGAGWTFEVLDDEVPA